ncbi:hypothetical protein RhiLY_07698 [Ceratobasidium sp. AG-Ba]|nr:hypothetical protein RhiLY_07698 [Ceratobasidium sp. AG-Ba]
MSKRGSKILVAPETHQFSCEKFPNPGLVRAMNCFMFYTGSKKKRFFEFSFNDVNDAMWAGVQVSGFVAPLKGSARHHRMAGWWSWRNYPGHTKTDRGGKDVEYMVLDNIVGLSWESNPSFRGGTESIMMLHTGANIKYALEHPDPLFGSRWNRILASYALHMQGPTRFQQIWLPAAKPGWWKTMKDWDFFLDHATPKPATMNDNDTSPDVSDLPETDSSEDDEDEETNESLGGDAATAVMEGTEEAMERGTEGLGSTKEVGSTVVGAEPEPAAWSGDMAGSQLEAGDLRRVEMESGSESRWRTETPVGGEERTDEVTERGAAGSEGEGTGNLVRPAGVEETAAMDTEGAETLEAEQNGSRERTDRIVDSGHSGNSETIAEMDWDPTEEVVGEVEAEGSAIRGKKLKEPTALTTLPYEPDHNRSRHLSRPE